MKKKKIGVVFIHGFTGDEKTWQNNNGKKFSDLLEADSQLANDFDFFEFDYYSKILSFFDSAPFQRIFSLIPLSRFFGIKGKVRSNQPIRHISELLSTYLSLNLDMYDKVVLIAHSMGGLIAKDCILNHQLGYGPNPVAFISIAVPHKGAPSASVISMTGNINASELKPLSEYSDKLNNDWTTHRADLPLCLYIIAQYDELVPKTSSIPFTVKKNETATVAHDHVSVCKPENKTDLAYLAVSNFLNKISYQEKMAEIATTTASSASPEYDKEIFVIKMIICDIGEKGVDDAKDSFFNAEIISKSADKHDRVELKNLQTKVLSLYRQTYNEYSSQNLSSNEIFANVHKVLLSEDNAALKTGVKYLNFLHKKGLLHQMANSLCTTVTWSDKTDFDEIKARMQ